ncbi:E3 ubiquitin/ISG15 ligase TRIM25-like [Bombina bombina]|uniref:E3 ubiquitin/ISG15 ligase TRIM25-like n=1 Tax=Bombina bombina TaxID=8345 RepID=UPI00235A9BE7|nr:E3 ubiquitin/ISG15 ligase TRIM25-like [Bombina bombina]
MASRDLSENSNCSICKNMYIDPVTLSCGHIFCNFCITKTWDGQNDEDASCPECRQQFKRKPALKRNVKVCNIAEQFRSTEPETEIGIFCTYCVDYSVPANKSCLLCEASFCDTHLRVHSKSEEHILTKPTTSWSNRKCPIHKKSFEYYCYEEAASICVICSLAEEHKGHQMELLNETSEKKKKKLRNILKNLTSKKNKNEETVLGLEDNKRCMQEKAAGITERVTDMIKDIRKQLEDLEKQVVSEINQQANRVLLLITDHIQQLEKEKEELSSKMYHIEDLCNTIDPLTVVQEDESHYSEFCGSEKGDDEGTHIDEKQVPGGGDLDEGLISATLYKGLADILTVIKIKRWFCVQEMSDLIQGVNISTDIVNEIKLNRELCMQEASCLLLDLNIASNYVTVSDDLQTASWTEIHQRRPETPERFQYAQVLSTRSFLSGKHYWEVETSKSGWWSVGMCYPSIKKKGDLSRIGNNNKSWCLCWFNKVLLRIHDSARISIPHTLSCQRIGIYLDYENGLLSFYELCDPIRHIHTFSATFTEPLHAAFWVWYGWVRIRS